MAREIEITVDFEEVFPTIEGIKLDGMCLSGSAVLASSDPTGDRHEFYVKSVTIDGGMKTDAKGSGAMGFPSLFRKVLFKSVEDALTNDRTKLGQFMQAQFSEAVRDAQEGDPDRAFDERRDRQMAAVL
jgi:hypothetical protein